MKIAFCCAEDINIGSGYLIAHLKRQGHEVRLFLDPRQYARGYAQNSLLARILSQRGHILRHIKAYKPDLCLFGPVTANYQWALSMAEAVKHRLPDCKIIFGGVHATLVPDEVRKHKFIDEVVVGDGIAYFGGTFDPDKLWPDREIFLEQLPPIHREYQIFMTSIGCPFNCSYCGNEQMRKVSQFKFIRRSVDGCIAELQYLKSRGMKYVLFVDDILTCDKKWLLEFMPKYKTEIGLPFCCFGHPKYLDEETVAALKDGGCHSIWIGIQTGDEGIRKQILNRPESNKEIVDSCAIVKRHGIKLIIDHIFGIPAESAISNDISNNLYTVIKPDIVNCYNLLYFPKAKIIDFAVSMGNLTPQQVKEIEEGKGAVYQLTNKNQDFYRQYAKTFCAIPVGGLIAEILPMSFIKLIAYARAGRMFIPWAMIQNEIYFTVKSLWRKLT
ncbi:MAG: radical SAM protein [Candidatus Omnitrophota bacterium]